MMRRCTELNNFRDLKIYDENNNILLKDKLVAPIYEYKSR